MELRHIRYFMVAAEELNFTRAAEKLCIAQPPLSRQIQDLEEELGSPLFIRKPRGLQLTEEGSLFKQYARQILGLVDKVTDEIREMKTGLQGTLYLATVEGHGPSLFSQWIAGFQKLYPHVQYNLWNGNSDDVTDRVMNGLCDLAIIMEPHNGEGLDSFRVYQEPWIAMLPLDNPLAQTPSDSVSIAQLAPYELIVPSRRSRIDEIRSWFSAMDCEPIIRCQVAHMMNAYELTEQGVGIAIYPASAAEMARDGSICVKRIAQPPIEATYILVWNKNHQLSLVAQKFMEYVENLY